MREGFPLPRLRCLCPGLVLLGGTLGAALGGYPNSGAGAGTVTVSRVEYKGWKNNLKLTNGDAELIVTLDVGPRVISYRLLNEKNVLKEYPDQLGKSGEPDWQIRGGHRLWVAPEDLTRTYSPDNGPVTFRQEAGQVRFTPARESRYGLQKAVTVRLAPSGSRVTVVHSVTNVGEKSTSLAPWASTVLAPGGIEIIPLPPKKDHPGSPANATSPRDYAPNLGMALWPYFDFRDDRWAFGGKYLTLQQKARRGPTKLGLAHREGWVGYVNDSVLFVKRFAYQEGRTYPDCGCNFETFSNADMLEIETLGPLVELAPGAAAELTERWELVPNINNFKGEAGIDLNVLPRVSKE
jgi:hypothetical protein